MKNHLCRLLIAASAAGGCAGLLPSAAAQVSKPSTAPSKLDARLRDGELPAWAIVDASRPGDPVLGVYVVFNDDAALGGAAWKLLEKHGGSVQNELVSVHAVVAHVSKSKLLTLAAEPTVRWIEAPLPLMGDVNFESRVRTQANLVAASPYNLNGAGVAALIYDGGLPLTTHLDLVGRVTTIGGGFLSTHSTHVAGTVGGSGAATPSRFYTGFAPGVQILSAGLQASGSGLPLYNNPGDIEADYSQAINTHQAAVANNSIGTNVAQNQVPCSIEGDYGITDAIIDNVVRGSLGAPIVIAWAAGNERGNGRCGTGYATIPPPAGAKNPIIVGAINSNDDSMTFFSSWGPTDDGRIKPDVVAPGCEIGNDGGITSCSAVSPIFYESLCGTSMACPAVTGVAALIIQDFRAHFPQAGNPLNSTVKMLLIHTAQDLLTPGPDYQTGYGSVRVKGAIDLLRAGTFAVEMVSQGQGRSYQAQVDPRDNQLKVTLVWDDPGVVGGGTGSVLVNDLDLIVTDPSGRQWFPWTLNPADPAAPAVRVSADHLNNVEQVHVDNPMPGQWSIRVAGFAVPSGPQTMSVGWSARPCLCNWNAAGGVNSQDYFDFLTDFFTGHADFNNSGATTAEDFFDFLACFVAGCR